VFYQAEVPGVHKYSDLSVKINFDELRKHIERSSVNQVSNDSGQYLPTFPEIDQWMVLT